MIKRLFIVFSLLPLVLFSDVQNDQLLQLQEIRANTSWLVNIKGEYSRVLSDILNKNTSIETAISQLGSSFLNSIKDNINSIREYVTQSISSNVWQLRNNSDSFVSWWNKDLSLKVDKASDQVFYFLKNVEDPYELNERTRYELVNNPGDTVDRDIEPLIRSQHIDATFKDYFEYYSNEHLDYLAANNKFLADIALSLSPTNATEYNVYLPYGLDGWTTMSLDGFQNYYVYIDSINTMDPANLFVEVVPEDLAQETFTDPNEAIIYLLNQTFDLQLSYGLPLMVMITNQQAIISRLTNADTSFTNELAQTVQDDLSDPGKYDTELDSLIQMLDIKESSFHTSFMRSFSSPSSDGIGFQLLENLSINLPNFSDFEFPTIDIDISSNRRLFEILRKCMIAFWGILSFTFWLFIYKVFLRIILFFARFFAPQVSDGLGKS